MAKFVSLTGSQRHVRAGSKPIGPVDNTEVATITVLLRSGANREELEKWVLEQSAKPVADRTYLSKQKLASQYGAVPSDLNQLEQYAAKHNLTVVTRDANSRAIRLRGQIGDLVKAFPANLRMYQHATGIYRGRTGEIQIPPEFAGKITGILGFDTRRKRRARFRTHVAARGGTV